MRRITTLLNAHLPKAIGHNGCGIYADDDDDDDDDDDGEDDDCDEVDDDDDDDDDGDDDDYDERGNVNDLSILKLAQEKIEAALFSP